MPKILSIDDSAQIRHIMRGAAEVLGYELLEAEDGEQGLKVLADNYTDVKLVLLDVNMPKMLGFEVLRRIRADSNLKHIPVMMVTTESEKAAIIGAIKDGANNYVTKPFSNEDLVTKIIETLGAV
jgi:two-component system chemotaxis response regulator CheY